MPGEIRAVVDTNIFVSGVIYREGPPGEILIAFREGRFVLITSAAVKEEILEVLNRPRINKRYRIGERIMDVGAILYTQALMVEPKQRVKLSSDRDDNKFIEAALLGGADYIVTGDKKDMLSLNGYQGIRIVTPVQFLQILI